MRKVLIAVQSQIVYQIPITYKNIITFFGDSGQKGIGPIPVVKI